MAVQEVIIINEGDDSIISINYFCLIVGLIPGCNIHSSVLCMDVAHKWSISIKRSVVQCNVNMYAMSR